MVNFTVSLQTPQAGDVELADVVRQFGSEYTSHYGHVTLPSHRRALADIASCCTKQCGGELHYCHDCQDSFWRYHSCRNRACPKCQGPQTQQWLERRERELLPCDYFHAVATVPSELRPAFRRDQKFMYGLLMRVAAQAVIELCADKRHLGGLPGVLVVLHSWNAQLGFHPHAHLLITGGGVTSDGHSWQPARGKFLVPVRRLSRKIALKFRDALHKHKPQLLASIPPRVWNLDWVSFCKHYGRGNQAVLHYLSRYVYRTAISNARILAMDQTHVTFRYKHRDSDSWQTCRLPGVQFLSRFLQHVLPRGFHRVRYYGLWHPSQRERSSQVWFLLTLQATQTTDAPSLVDRLAAIDQLLQFTDDLDTLEQQHASDEPCPCPRCGGTRTTLLAMYERFTIP